MAQRGKGSKQREKKEEQGKRGSHRKSLGGRSAEDSRRETGLARREQSASLPTVSPFSLMRRFSEEMDRLFGDFDFGGHLASGFGRESGRLADLEVSMWLPQVEAFERDGKLIVRADLPGLTKDDIKVEITDDAIKIRGERRQEKEEDEEGYYRSERSYGSFYREIPLPSGVKHEEANASFSNGVLEITVPAPARQLRSRRIEIGEGPESEQQSKAMGKAAGK
ncbi:MAG TPA: Hsp20/alpha crystallin family protein [Pyrinomonadaceae bacterium]|nr:Hsp20/alpha crystallin family protein [Pyrinomonadaceae bacterium]